MTREEEIIETAKFIYSPSSGIPQSLPMRVGFIEGAKWADKTMIEKACNWLKDRISIPYKGNYNEDDEQPIASDYINFVIERLKIAEEICNDFRKAMEE